MQLISPSEKFRLSPKMILSRKGLGEGVLGQGDRQRSGEKRRDKKAGKETGKKKRVEKRKNKWKG